MKTNIFYKFIASVYDLLDVIYFRNYDRSPRKAVIEAISENDKILDLCTGTATNAMDISRAIPSSEIVGVDLSENINLDRYKIHTIEAVVDRISIKPDISQRLAESIEIFE